MFQFPKDRAAGLNFVAIGAADFPPGRLAGYYERLGRLHGLSVLRGTIEVIRRFAEMVLRQAVEQCAFSRHIPRTIESEGFVNRRDGLSRLAG